MEDMVKEIQGLVDIFKDDDDAQYEQHPYANLEKAAVLQDARIFHDSTAVKENPRKCCLIIAKLLHLQNTGQFIGGQDATEIFFGVTKLFVSNDASLRRMVYLFIKEVYESCDKDDVIIVTSSLTKDMTCDIDLYRANALRVLCRIVDSAMLGAIERYIKQAIVDSSPQVASSAIVSSLHLFDASQDCASIVRRWISETQEALKNPNRMVQFHAMQLLYQIKSHDRLGVSKLITQYSRKGALRSALAVVCLVRYTTKLLNDEVSGGRVSGTNIQNGSQICRTGFQFLEACLRHKSHMVVYEAARAICFLPLVEPQDLTAAITALSHFLTLSKPATRFATMKTLATVAVSNPRAVSKCNEEFETLIGDKNRSIATLAITTLLKTGSENSVDRILRQVSGFLTQIDDEYKITVVKSLQQLCLTYPSKHRIIVGFLSNFLREEGGFEFKRSIVNGIVSLMRSVPETTESSLLHLCEFIEDCEFTMLSTHVLHLLGELGPGTSAPARYIRFIYNRSILENRMIRAAAVSSLGMFAARCPSLRPSILTLLRRSLVDEDDETRDRAVIAVAMLEEAIKQNPYVPPPEDADAEDIPPDVPVEGDIAAFTLAEGLPMSFDKLERSIKAYQSTPGAMESAETITFSSLPVLEDTPEEIAIASSAVEEMAGLTLSTSPRKEKKREAVDPAAVIYAIPELASLGRVFRSSHPVELTEDETEYVVRCIKHIFESHVVLQFSVQNTIEDQRLDNVSISVDGDSESGLLEATGEIACESISYGATGNCFTVLDRNQEVALETTRFSCEMHFTVVQVDKELGDETGESFEEEYPLEDLEITTNDFMSKVSVPDFRAAWESIGDANEVLEKFALQFKSLDAAVAAVVDFLGMLPCDGTGTVKSTGRSKPHMLHMSGVFVGGRSVLARAQVAMQKGEAECAVLKIAVRSEDMAVSRMIADCIK